VCVRERERERETVWVHTCVHAYVGACVGVDTTQSAASHPRTRVGVCVCT